MGAEQSPPLGPLALGCRMTRLRLRSLLLDGRNSMALVYTQHVSTAKYSEGRISRLIVGIVGIHTQATVAGTPDHSGTISISHFVIILHCFPVWMLFGGLGTRLMGTMSQSNPCAPMSACTIRMQRTAPSTNMNIAHILYNPTSSRAMAGLARDSSKSPDETGKIHISCCT